MLAIQPIYKNAGYVINNPGPAQTKSGLCAKQKNIKFCDVFEKSENFGLFNT